MSTRRNPQATEGTFPHQFTSMAGSLFAPPNMDKTKKYSALAIVHPFGGVKEQTAGIYARKMAERICNIGFRRQSFVKVDGAWLFAQRLLYVDWIEERALFMTLTNRVAS